MERDASIDLRVREATRADWPSIWPFLREIVAAGDSYTWPTDIAEADAVGRWFSPQPWRVFVAVATDGRIVGTAKVGPNHDGPGSHVANASFMVSPTSGRKGVGRRLAEHVIEHARSTGYTAMQFNAVVATNEGAVALWRSLGFEIVATVPEAFRHPTAGFVGLHVMYRRLEPPRIG